MVKTHNKGNRANQIRDIISNPSDEKLRTKTGKTMLASAAARALVILPEAQAPARQQAAKEPGPSGFTCFAAQRPSAAKKHIG